MRFLFIAFGLVSFQLMFAQHQKQPSAAEIKLKLNKLNFLGSVLYVAAHPDDENTRAIAFLANDRMASTAYLSMTRGDGGQNLIGSEIRDQLGLIRTQELLAARRIDGGQQFFTRANDFGFSKNAKETFEIWNKEEVLSDVVKVIRQFQPDVILTRFPPDERAGHGHHTASAVLAQEAFDLSNDATKYPKQVEDFGVWQVKRMYTNTGRWWNQTINENTPGILAVNVGGYNMLLGKSYAEIAADSRTQHKSQGFGSPGRRGDAMEFFEFVKGTPSTKDFFENVNTGWSRLKGSEKIQPLVDKVIAEYKFENPSASLPLLVQIRKEISALPFSVWRDRKWKEVNQLIQDCAGLYVEVVAATYWGTPGESTTVNFEVINRSPAEVMMTGIHSDAILYDTTFSTVLKNNVPFLKKSTHPVAASSTYSSPYWLTEPHSIGLFTVADRKMIGKPENDPAVIFNVKFVVNGEGIIIQTPLIYKWTDPVKGELMRPFEIVPPLFVNLTKPVYIFRDQDPQEVTVLLKATKDGVDGKIKLELPKGWKSVPTSIPINLAKRGQEQSATFRVIASKDELNATVKAVAEINDKASDYSLQLIDYDHIPTQTLMPKAEAEALRIDLKKEGSVVGYIRGAGDDVPGSLRNMGYEVWEMKNEEITAANLKKVDAVVLGVRTLNTNERIKFFMTELLEYVKQGGTLVVQYNTNSDFEIEKDKFAPYPITLSRDRVTEENSEVRILKPDHPALNYPNKITSKDFEGWVQERGLYFPSNWHENYDALLSCNDTGEPAKNGSLLIANYGLGHYVYTGLSFFRELPEGVPGAYRLFANLVSLGKPKKLGTVKGKKSK
ncbi:MAG: PIG-L family deacetylase [Cytophagales bacterium]|jgi:LmbE family N-acetylglucosaminyl deacetylase|nr:PIG-L family deacetylase [Cytophagales bacterium]MCA6387298.1 PIG-L family deacetylase [Cytophagales bacterium]MCA6391732.1 PIG-L family deacetylase [Cytophagales bacterium]MCA6393965.1 PIG-L family deacetylase [Cytophagales bacterium]MCA6398899.1 PIG-L family deacetylase [Cytophagales bacterium]